MTTLEERYGNRYDPTVVEAMLAQDNGRRNGLPEYLGMAITGVGPGWCEVDLEVTVDLLNPFGAADGAVVASIVDHALGTVVFPLLPLGTWPATLEFKLNYLAPVRPGLLRARAEVVSISARTAVVTVECVNRGRVAATALGTIAITPPKQT